MLQSRAEYSAIPDRAPLRLPNQARVAAWVIINVEDWQFGEPLPRAALPAPQGVAVMPDIPNYSWFEYGLRVGFWRIKDALDRRGIKATVSLNASVCDTYPRLVQACVDSGWEILAHGYVQRAINVESNERDVIRRTVERIAQQTGRRPRGWMGPGLHETYETPDILAEEGIEYCCDWVNDDQPYPMRVSRGRLVSIPYTVELNDIPMFPVPGTSPELSILLGEIERAEAAGFRSVWIPNIRGFDALTVLALAGARTRWIELGTGVVPT